jgi:predicted RNA-binding protein with EMAP domain
MSATENLKNLFGELVEAYNDADDVAKESLAKKIKDSGKSLRVVIDDELQWEESQVEGYDECPMVVQSITVFLGEESVCKVERWFGSEMIDPTHTGVGGRWETLRVDEGGHGGLIELLEDFGHSIGEPDVPEWR